MRGAIFTELRKFVRDLYGRETWQTLLRKAELLTPKMYVDTGSYADAELESLVQTAVQLTSLSRTSLLEVFGESLGAGLIAKYKSLLKPEWNVEDVLMNTEHAIHQVVRARHPNADPPGIKVEEVRKGEFRLFYTSKRNLLPVAKGIVKAVAKHYGREVIVNMKQANGEQPAELHIWLCFDTVPKYLLRSDSADDHPSSPKIATVDSKESPVRAG